MWGRLGLLLALVALAGGVLWWSRSEPGASAKGALAPAPAHAGALEQGGAAPAPDALPAPTDRTAAVTEGPAEPERVAAPADGDGVAPEILAALRRYAVAGRAYDVGGRGLADVELFAAGRPDERLAVTRGDGGFELQTRKASLELEGRRPGWATVRSGIVDRERAAREVRVVLAPAVALAGRVVDPEGRGVEGARLALERDWRGIPGFPLPLDDTRERATEMESGPDGGFAFDAVPRLAGRPLRVTKEGFEPLELEVPALARTDLELRLERSPADPVPEEPAVFGVVRLPDGTPAGGARVQIAQDHTTSDRDGRFELARPSGFMSEGLLLVAMLEGWQPAVFEELPRLLDEQPGRIGPLELTLPGPALSIRGRLELADGKPAKKWSLRLLDATVLDETSTPTPTLENGGDTSGSGPRTDAEGRFELTGLSDRSYALRLWQPRSFVSVDSGPVPAGTQDLVLRVPEGAVLAELTGRVTTRGGAPVEGAEVSLQFITMQTRNGFTWETPAETRTDAQGAFRFEDVPRRSVNLVVFGADVVTQTYEPEGGAFDGAAIEIEVERLFRVQLDYAGQDPTPDGFQMLDAAGDALQLETRTAHGRTSSTQMQLQEGRSPVVAVSEAAATLVLTKDYAEIDRRPVTLAPGEVNQLRP